MALLTMRRHPPRGHASTSSRYTRPSNAANPMRWGCGRAPSPRGVRGGGSIAAPGSDAAAPSRDWSCSAGLGSVIAIVHLPSARLPACARARARALVALAGVVRACSRMRGRMGLRSARMDAHARPLSTSRRSWRGTSGSAPGTIRRIVDPLACTGAACPGIRTRSHLKPRLDLRFDADAA